jgi:hypothetical protein
MRLLVNKKTFGSFILFLCQPLPQKVSPLTENLAWMATPKIGISHLIQTWVPTTK